MVQIAICDDEAPMRKYIRNCLGEYSVRRDVDIECIEYNSGDALFNDKTRHNIILLDYQLDSTGEQNGLTVAKRLRKSGVDTPIIFLTNHPKMVFSSFEVNTFRFLVKPLEISKLFKALDDYLKSIEIDTTLTITQNREAFFLSTKQITFVEGDGKYCIIHLNSKPEEMECHETLAQVEERLPRQYFFRCHRSIVVNLRYISSYTNDGVTLRNKKWIPISRSKNDSFKDAYIEYSKKYGY